MESRLLLCTRRVGCRQLPPGDRFISESQHFLRSQSSKIILLNFGLPGPFHKFPTPSSPREVFREGEDGKLWGGPAQVKLNSGSFSKLESRHGPKLSRSSVWPNLLFGLKQSPWAEEGWLSHPMEGALTISNHTFPSFWEVNFFLEFP